MNGIKSHYNLTCSLKTIKEAILKPMGQKWLRRSCKPGVPADRPAWGVFQVFPDEWGFRLVSLTVHFLDCTAHLVARCI